jgi:CheY-like chemotaxis protein
MRTGPILVVEDVPNVRELLEVTLRFKGYKVVSATNGKEGLAKVESENPAMVITDILMPVLDGYAFVQALRTNPSTRTLPVIFLSATYVTPEDRTFALSLGANRFMEKPIDTEDFLLTVAEIMAQDAPTQPVMTPLNTREFYTGYKERLENKLRHKNTQIARTERLIPTLAPEQKTAFEGMLNQARNDRENIKAELREVQRSLDELLENRK